MSEPTLLANPPELRDNDWLADRLAEIWYRYFPDISQPNEVLINFGRKSRTRLGSIGMPGWQQQGKSGQYQSKRKVEQGTSIITITGHFKDPRVPTYVIDATIAHELTHYAHGFHSPHPQKHADPHRGGIVDKELTLRGLGETLKLQKTWLKQEWIKIIGRPKPRRRRRYARMSFLPAYR